MTALEIRLATEDEQAIVKNLLNNGKNRKVTYGDMSWGKMLGWRMPEIQQHFAESSVYLVRAQGEELPIATIALQNTDIPTWGEQSINDKALYIHRLSVRDDFKGKGIGGRILDWALTEAQEADMQFLRLDCNVTAVGLIKVYENYGFERIEERPLPQYQDYTAQLMQKSIGGVA